MEKLLISRCLLGDPVRYDGRGAPCHHPLLRLWQREGRLVPLCPELEGGLSCPRPPAEITGGDGAAVLEGHRPVLDNRGTDVSAAFVRGAESALILCRQEGIRFALLKARSPSCGSRSCYDGSFSATLVPGRGVTAARLAAAGIEVFDEAQLDLLADRLHALAPD